MKKTFLPPYVKVEKFTQFDVIATSAEAWATGPDFDTDDEEVGNPM